MTTDPRVDMVNFTGSTEVGSKVAAQDARAALDVAKRIGATPFACPRPPSLALFPGFRRIALESYRYAR